MKENMKENKLLCINNCMYECGGGNTKFLKGFYYDANKGHIGLSGSSLNNGFLPEDVYTDILTKQTINFYTNKNFTKLDENSEAKEGTPINEYYKTWK